MTNLTSMSDEQMKASLFQYVRYIIRDRIATKFDQEVGNDWKYFADECGLDNDIITSIQSQTRRCGERPMHAVFTLWLQRWPFATVGDFMVICEKLGRTDVILVIKKAYQELELFQNQRSLSRRESGRDVNCNIAELSVPECPSTMRVNASSVRVNASSVNTYTTPSQQYDRSEGEAQLSTTLPRTPTNVCINTHQNQPYCQQVAYAYNPTRSKTMYQRQGYAKKKQLSLFLTYASDQIASKTGMRNVYDNFHANGFDVKLDMTRKEFMKLTVDKIGWLDHQFNTSDVILICCSHAYKDEARLEVVPSNLNNHSLNTRYIETLMKSEYFHRGCKNYRFIPIVMPGSEDQHVPEWLRNTVIYHWPMDFQKLVNRLKSLTQPPPPSNLGSAPEIVQRIN
ncbi:uncharacterized protein LOC144441040 [Glandiceps talaboti]